MRRSQVTGQTGTTVLSDEKLSYKLSKKRTVRYQYEKIGPLFLAWVTGPFHSKLYGTCGFGTKKSIAKAALQSNLLSFHGYIGTMLYSDVDDADNVGKVNRRLLDANSKAGPITRTALCGSAGQ